MAAWAPHRPHVDRYAVGLVTGGAYGSQRTRSPWGRIRETAEQPVHHDIEGRVDVPLFFTGPCSPSIRRGVLHSAR